MTSLVMFINATRRSSIFKGLRLNITSRLQSTSSYPFPKTKNPSPWEVFHLPPDADASQIKQRYFELVRIYHPDTAQSQGIAAEEAEARFHAVTNAYNTLQQRDGRVAASDPFDSEAEEIKKRLATWAKVDARRSYSAYDKERRARALEAEASAGKWWRSEMMFYYMLGGAAMALVIMYTQNRAAPAQRERVRKYLELHRRPPPSEPTSS